MEFSKAEIGKVMRDSHRYDTPVKTLCVPAAPGTQAIVRVGDREDVGPWVIAWNVCIRQDKKGDTWPDETFVEAVTYFGDRMTNIVGVVHPDGTVDYGENETFPSYSAWREAQAGG